MSSKFTPKHEFPTRIGWDARHKVWFTNSSRQEQSIIFAKEPDDLTMIPDPKWTFHRILNWEIEPVVRHPFR